MTLSSSQIPEKTGENRATIVPLHYNRAQYDLTVSHGHRGFDYERVGIGPDYVVMSMYIPDPLAGRRAYDGDHQDEFDRTHSIGFHDAESYVRAMEALLEHGVKAFGLEILDDLGIQTYS